MWWWFFVLFSTACSILIGCGKDRKILPKKSSKKSQKSDKAKSGMKNTSKSSKSTKSKSKSKASRTSKSSRTNSIKSGKSAKSLKSKPLPKKPAPVARRPSSAPSCSSSPAPASAPIETRLENVEHHQIPLSSDRQYISYKGYGGLESVTIANPSHERRAFKIKCTDNQLYRVNPVYGIVEPGQSARIDVLRHNGSIKTDKLVVISVAVNSSDVSPKDALSARSLANSNSELMMTIPLIAEPY